MDPAKLYKKEVEMSINEHKAKGVQVELKKPSYKFIFELPEKPSVVKITTCHREDTFRDVGKRLEYVYQPVHGLEDVGYCPLEIGAFDVEGAHTWGMVDFQDDETLLATIGCNGQTFRYLGVSICQSRYGLIQTIKFEDPVKVFFNEPCDKPETKDQRVFMIEAVRDKCVYLFASAEKNHRLTMFGYDEVYIK